MKAFLSRYSFKIDRKGRVSVPAEYRQALAELGSDGILAFPSLTERAIRCMTSALIEKITAEADPLSVFAAREPSLAQLSLSDIVRLAPDPEGRVVLPAELIQHAGLTEVALFAGQGTHFEIWDLVGWNEQLERLRSGGNPTLPPGMENFSL